MTIVSRAHGTVRSQVLVGRPQVHDRFAVLIDAHRRADFPALTEIALELRAHRGKARIAVAIDQDGCLLHEKQLRAGARAARQR